MAFFDDCILIKTNKNDVVIPYPAVEDIVVGIFSFSLGVESFFMSFIERFNLQILDSIPKDTKGRVWILLHLNEYVTSNTTRIVHRIGWRFMSS